MRLQAPILWLAACAVALCGCGSDASTQRPDSGWQIEESGDVAEETPVPDGVPDDYVDHPHEERVHSLDVSKDACVMPEGVDDPKRPIGYFKAPSIGGVGILGLSRGAGDAPKRIDGLEYDVYIRFPRKSADWHRFEIRSRGDDGREASGKFWKGAWESASYMQPSLGALSFRVRTSGCEPASQREIERFADEYSEIEIKFYNPQSGGVFAFGPTQPLEQYTYDSTAAFGDRAGVGIVYEFPVNREKSSGPYLAPQPDRNPEDEDTDWGYEVPADSDD